MLGRGGEGSVFALSDPAVVAKVYHRPADDERAAKIGVMARLRTERLTRLAAWPIETLHDGPGGATVGLIMPRVTGYRAIHNLYGPKTRRVEFPRAGWPFCIHAAANVARAFAVIHEHGHVIGDVNHGNVVVSGQATAMLIDCDSFQIAAGGWRFLCDVGVSTHQPPELQTLPTFRGVARTPNHDNFGLAVLIFQLLMMGRHPFAGTYLGSGDMPIERAIRELRFAYSPAAQSRQMKPPPNTLPFDALAPSVGRLFERAFSSGGARDGGRPLARDWVRALEQLGERLKRCDRQRGHSYLETLTTCPWCAIESQTGVRLFAATAIDPARPANAFDLEAVWAEILSVKSPGVAPPLPGRVAILSRRPNRARRKECITTVSQVAAAVVATIFRIPDSDGGKARPPVGASRDPYQPLAARWKREAGDQAFRRKLHALEQTRAAYLALATRRLAATRQVVADPRQRQLRQFLDRYPLTDANLPGVGPGREAMLRSYGIETAADVTEEAIGAIPGFGPSLTASLLTWRRSIERRFVFDPRKPIDPSDVDDPEDDLRAAQRRLEQTLRGGAAELRTIVQRIETRRRELRVEMGLKG
jgi:DNA-binding helix-hairpin-helix protein with protein kinase domain